MGRMTGFFNVPGEQHLRQQEMTNFMKDFLLKNLQQAIKEIDHLSSTENELNHGVKKEDIEVIALQTATEFCLIIGKPELIFNDIYVLF